MNFSGWVPMRRGILEHTMTEALSNNEALVLMTLILLADHKTGLGRINAPALRTYLPELSYDSAKRALLSLEEKGYIWRSIVHRAKAVYPYLINNYEISDGPNKGLHTDLSQVIESKDISQVRYVSPPPQHPLQTALRRAPETTLQIPLVDALHNNNDKNINMQKEEKQTTSLNKEKCATSRDHVALDVRQEERIAERTAGPGDAHVALPKLPSGAPTSSMIPTEPNPTRTNGVGMRWTGEGFNHTFSGKQVDYTQVNQRIAPLGLTWRQCEFFRIDTNEPVDWNQAREQIEGTKERRAA